MSTHERLYSRFTEWRVALYAVLHLAPPNVLRVIASDMRRTIQRIDDELARRARLDG